METLLTRALPVLAGSIVAGGAAEDLLRAVTEHTPVGMFLSDTDGSCRFVNRRWCELSGLLQEEALGDGWAAALHPDDRERVGAEWVEAAAAGRDSVISYRFRRPDATVVWIDGYASAFHGRDGSLAGWVGACLDVSGHRRTETELWTQAHTDPLTGLPNRRALDERLGRVAATDAQEGRLALVVIDIDHFKRVNDRYGHLAGDEVLVAVAQTLRRRVRESDLAVRLGGDEFAVLAPTENPQRLAADLLAAIRTICVDVGETEITVTASAGMTTLAASRIGNRTLVEAADHALYRAKREGRDRYVADAGLIAV